MKRRNDIRSKIIMNVICVLALVLATVSTQGWAATCDDPGGDFDKDGLKNMYECGGLVENGTDVFITYPSCPLTSPGPSCIHPERKDLFVMIYRETDKIPTVSPLEFITNSQSVYGLGIAIHEIPYVDANPNRLVTSTQKAVRITEMPDNDNNLELGHTQVGTPIDGDDALVYPQRIKNHINTVCTHSTKGTPLTGNKCMDKVTLKKRDPLMEWDALKEWYVKHTLAHETAHALNLKQPPSDSLGNHYPDLNKVVLSQHVFYKRVKPVSNPINGEKIVWFIGTKFTSADIAGMMLK